MEIDDGGENLGKGSMITALCWVPRGRARAVLKEADEEQNETEMKKHKKLQQKLSK